MLDRRIDSRCPVGARIPLARIPLARGPRAPARVGDVLDGLCVQVGMRPTGAGGSVAPNSRGRSVAMTASARWRRRGAAMVTAMLVAAMTPVAAAGSGRVIAVGGAVTEIVYRLERADALVAVDSTSTHPPAARELPDVGYMRQLAAEPMLSMRPDHVLAAADAGPPVTLDQLREAGVRVTRVPDEPTPAGVVAKVHAVARALGAEERGRRLAARLESRFAALRERVGAVESRPSALVLIAAGAGNLMAAGRDTTATGILRLAGVENAVDAWSGYRPLSAEAAIEAAPDWIVLTRAALDSLGGRSGLRGHAGLGTTPAGRGDRIVAMDGLLLLGFGPRTPAAARRLAERIHPELQATGD